VLPCSAILSFLIVDFLFIISAADAHIQLKFDIGLHYRNMQVKFEFGHALMIFDRVIPLELGGKKQEIFSFSSLIFVGMCVYG
jgi:hypothetical protein